MGIPFRAALQLVGHKVHLDNISNKKRKSKVKQYKYIRQKRRRKSVADVYSEMGRDNFRRAYRMHYRTFVNLYHLLKSHMQRAMSYKIGWKKGSPNGRIHLTVRLAVAIRFFAGGSSVDLLSIYGISRTEVNVSVTCVIAAIRNCPSLQIKFPTGHNEQMEIAKGFQELSDSKFSNCVGAIDGMLVWIRMPSKKECAKVGVGQKKFFCARKNKYGLNMQATCDSKRRFINVSIHHPAATSDFMAFQTSNFRSELEKEGFLSEGLCLFGDSAYVNTKYMVTPYQRCGSGTAEDNFNFFQSQVRITIECAFGVLVQRWGILRTPAPQQFSIKKVCDMVFALCQLHNFLINIRIEQEQQAITTNAEDEWHMVLNGGVDMRQMDGHDGVVVPKELLLGNNEGVLMEDVMFRRQVVRAQVGKTLPRERLLAQVYEQDIRRPLRRK